MNVTNTHTPEKTSVKGKKIWKGDENHKDARPASIQLNYLPMVKILVKLQ